MKWILQRNVPVSGVYVNVSFETNAYTRKKYLREHGKKIHRLIVGYERDIVEFADLQGLIRELCSLCPEVESLVCVSNVDIEDYHLMINTWPGLKDVTLSKTADGSVLDLLSAVCVNLTTIRANEFLDGNYDRGTERFFSTCNPGLQAIIMEDVRFSDEDFLLIFSRFK